MKIVEANVGVLTNFEVLDMLKSRGARKESLTSLGRISSSECKVFEYLVQSVACNQTKENINEFLTSSEKYGLAKAEKLNIINIRPSGPAEIFPIIEQCEERLSDKLEELVNMVVEILPPPPLKPE